MSSRGHPKKPALHLSKTGSGAGDDYTNTYSESAVKSANNPMRKAKPAFMSPEVNIGDIHSNNINKIATQEELETSAVNSDGQKVGSPSSDEVSYGKTYTGYEDDKEGIMPEALKASIESFGRKEKNSSPDLDTAHIYHKPGSDLESFSRAGSRPPLFSQNTVRNSLSGSGIVANRVKSFSFGSKSGSDDNHLQYNSTINLGLQVSKRSESFAAGSSSSGSIAAEVKRKPLLQKQQTAVLRNLPKMGPVTKNKAMFERNSVDNPSNHSDAGKKINKLPKGSFKPFLQSKSTPEIIHTKRAWHPTSGPGGAEPAETSEDPKFFSVVPGVRAIDTTEVSTVHSGSYGQSSHEYNSGSEHNYESDKHNKTEPAISTNDVTFGFSGSDLDDTGTLLNLVSLGKINNGGNSSPENISTVDIEGDDSASVKNYKKSLEEHVAEISASLDDSINTSEDPKFFSVVPGVRAIDTTEVSTVNSNSDEKSSREYNSGSEHGSADEKDADVQVDYDNLYNPDEVNEEYNPFPGKICESIAKGKSTKILIEPDSADNNAAGKSTTSTKPIKASSRITDAELKKIYKHRYRPKQKKHSDINIPVSDTVISDGPLPISSPPISSKSTKGRRFITSLTDRAEVTTKPVSLGFTMPSTTETKHHSISFAGSGYDPVKSDTVADTDYTAPKSTDLRAAAAGKTSEITAPIKAESRLSPAVTATGSVATAKPKAKREPILAASGVIGVTAFGKSSAPAGGDLARPVITGKAAFDPLAIDTEEILLEDITDEISEDILPEKPVVAATVKSSAGSIDRAKPTDAAVTKSATKPATATTKLTGPKLADSELIRLATEIMAKEDEEIPNKLAALKKILKPAAIKDKNIAEEDLLEESETTEETDHSTEETDHTTEEADHSTDSAATFSDTKPYYWPRSGYGGYAATGYTMPTYGYAASRYVPSSYATFGAIPAVSTVSATANNPVAAVNVQQASFAPVSRAIVPAAYQQRIAANAVQSGTAIHNQSTASDTFTAQNKIAQNSGNGLEDKSLLLGGLTSTGMGGAAIATGVLLASPAVAIILGVMSGASALATGAKAASNKTARTSFTDRLALAQQSDNSTISF